MNDKPDDLESALFAARDDVRGELAGVSVPDFVPNRRTGPVAGAALGLILLVGGVFALSNRDASEFVEAEPAGTTATTAVATTSAAPADSEATAPAFEPVTDIDVRLPADVPPPAVDETAIDPVFGSTSTRLTTAESGEFVTPVQAAGSAFNADGTRLLLYRTGGGHELYDVESKTFVGTVPIEPSDIEDVFWSPTEPNVLFYATGTQLFQFDVDSRVEDVVAEFADCAGLAMVAPPSWDGDRFALRCWNEALDAEKLTLLAYRQSDNSVVSVVAGDAGNALVSPSGDRFAFVDGDSGLVTIYDSTLTPTGITVDSGSSAAMSRRNGRDVLVTTGFGGVATGSVIAFDLETGEAETVIGLASGYPFPPGGTRLGVTAAPFVVVSAPEISDRSSWDVLDGEILLVDMSSAEAQVIRLAHNRVTPADEYFQRPFAAVSPDGTQVAYSSDWNLGDRANTYLIELAK